MPIKVIARVMGVSKNTVKAALRSDGLPRYERPLRGSVVDEVEPRIHTGRRQNPPHRRGPGPAAKPSHLTLHARR